MDDLFKGTEGKLLLLIATALVLFAESWLDRRVEQDPDHVPAHYEQVIEALNGIEKRLVEQLAIPAE